MIPAYSKPFGPVDPSCLRLVRNNGLSRENEHSERTTQLPKSVTVILRWRDQRFARLGLNVRRPLR